MSQEINNHQYRVRLIKDILRQLHEGKSVEAVTAQFAQGLGSVDVSEISAAEQELIAEGLPVTEIQQLCDVHAAVFKGSIAEIHSPAPPQVQPGHPINTLIRENRALERLTEKQLEPELTAWAAQPTAQTQQKLLQTIAQLQQIDRHYRRKEQLFFPYLEQKGIGGPPQVMWGVDDEIRAGLKTFRRQLEQNDPSGVPAFRQVLKRLEEMIFKEEQILVPLLQENLSAENWTNIARESAELGYCLIDPPPIWPDPPTGVRGAPDQPAPAPGAPPVAPDSDTQAGSDASPPSDGSLLNLPTGQLSAVQLEAILNALPVDLTFVDDQDRVRYFSEGRERVFPRTRSIIGREVVNCHPPASVHIVQGIIRDFKSGAKDQEDFWIQMGTKMILIRYYALRDPDGRYLGVLEATQDIAPLRALEGEKRLVSGQNADGSQV
ncbi:DUF438 domain-containing protein [Oscillospiraceae bacterium HV4-5-C5C]|nr:DUF438 domain-containing protein [Oscillospiraceae bacterium HV4-5-C5C]